MMRVTLDFAQPICGKAIVEFVHRLAASGVAVGLMSEKIETPLHLEWGETDHGAPDWQDEPDWQDASDWQEDGAEEGQRDDAWLLVDHYMETLRWLAQQPDEAQAWLARYEKLSVKN